MDVNREMQRAQARMARAARSAKAVRAKIEKNRGMMNRQLAIAARQAFWNLSNVDDGTNDDLLRYLQAAVVRYEEQKAGMTV